MQLPLRERSPRDTVENVYLFVADSVREGVTGTDVRSMGVSGRAIAPSTYTASSFPSLVSGTYPTSHRVWSFDDRLPERPALIDGPEEFGMAADTIWTHLSGGEKPPFRITGAGDDDSSPVSELEPPFVAIEHHKGGHLPYGYSFEECESTAEFFDEHRPSLHELPRLYEKSVRDAESAFLEAIDELADRGLLDDTLVIYTSDHGEVLGEAENGMAIGHGDPIVPDLVDVPIVFAGAGLPDGKLTRLVSGTDVAPTALSALGREETGAWDGRNLWTGTIPENRRCRSELWSSFHHGFVGKREFYRAVSVWDETGGYVFQHGSRLARTSLAFVKMFVADQSAYLKRGLSHVDRWPGFLEVYVPSIRRHGTPGFTESEARDETVPFEASEHRSEDAVDREHLRKLGYLE